MDKYYENIIKKAQDGDSGAFAEIYSYYSGDLYRFAFYMLGNREDAQDAVQDAVIVAFKNIHNLKKPDSFKSWLFKILSNCCKTRLAEFAKRGEVLCIDELFDLADERAAADLSSSRELCDALYSLSASERAIVLLSVLFGYKSRELSDIFAIPASTIRSKLSRALSKLKILIADSE